MQLIDVLRPLQRQPESSLEQKPLRYHTRSEQWLTDVTWTLAAPNPLASHSLYREPQTPVLFLGSGVTCWNTAPPPSQTQKPQKPSVITSEGQAQLTWTAGSSLPPQRQPTGSCSCWSFCSLMEQRTLRSNLQTGAEPLACTAESDEAPPCASPSQAQKRLHSPSRLKLSFQASLASIPTTSKLTLVSVIEDLQGAKATSRVNRLAVRTAALCSRASCGFPSPAVQSPLWARPPPAGPLSHSPKACPSASLLPGLQS